MVYEKSAAKNRKRYNTVSTKSKLLNASPVSTSPELTIMSPPSPFLLLTEFMRSGIDHFLYFLSHTTLPKVSQRGDNHPVLVLPGLGAGDLSTAVIRSYLDSIGYLSQPLNMGINTGVHSDTENQLIERLEYLYKKFNEPISLIGWSLGGAFARYMAGVRPEMVRQVITLGSPIAGHPSGTNGCKLYKFFNGKDVDMDLYQKIIQPLEVPSTSIYTKLDGVVHWKCSLQNKSPLTQNLHVKITSHTGLGFNPVVLYALSHILPYTRDTWKPLEKSLYGFLELT